MMREKAAISMGTLKPSSARLKMPRACTHHDDQQNILEVVPEAQCGTAEESEVSLQELMGRNTHSQILLPKHTHVRLETHNI